MTIEFELGDVKGEKLENVPGVGAKCFGLVFECPFEEFVYDSLEVLVVLHAEFSL